MSSGLLTVSSNKEKYRCFCQSTPDVPLFSKDWWLDAVSGAAGWDVAIVEKGGHIVGAMPYCFGRKYNFTLLTQPKLTQTLGPWIRPSSAKYAKALGQQKDIMHALIDQLPPFDHFSQKWHYSVTNWLPFYWRGFQQTTHYTYVLKEIADMNLLWDGLQENIRTDIRKAEGRLGLEVRDDLGVDNFLRLNRLTFARQGKALPYPEDLVRRIDRACASRGCRKIWIAQDDEGRNHAAAYVVWDKNSAYYLMGGGDPELRNSGATSLCLWKAIGHAAMVTKSFDFEGSMIESVERFCRGFGAVQTPYFKISKTPSILLRLRNMVRIFEGVS